MFRKLFISLLLAGVVVVVGNITIWAQMAPVSGKVELQQADGKVVPVPGAIIEVYRTDIQIKGAPGKTNKDGTFAFAGIAFGGTYLLAVSAPGCSPQVRPNVRAGNDNVNFVLLPGDGTKLTEAEARSSGVKVASGKTELTAEDKQKQAEYEAKVAELKAKNEKAQKANDIVGAAIKAGNDAYAAKNYDLAIAKYDEGVAADPDFVGTAPVLLNNRGAALRARAADTYNAAIKNTDANAVLEGKLKAKEDMKAAVEGYSRAWTLLKGVTPAEAASYDATKATTLRGTVDILRIAARTEQVDPIMIDAAKTMVPEYLTIETDPVKKTDSQLIMGDLYRATGDYPAAVEAYKKVLETSPDNPDALAMVGLCLFAQGAINNNDKAMLQEGANYLQKFVSVAPDTHRYKKDAMETLETLKNEQKIAPQKVPTGGKKRGS